MLSELDATEATSLRDVLIPCGRTLERGHLGRPAG